MGSEKADIRKFVFRELNRCSDLSTLTLGILRRRYLEHVGRESLSVEHKQLLKRIVEEELLKMQDNSSDEENLVMSAKPSQKQNKRKRDEQNEDDVVARNKKSRFDSVLPDSPDSGIEKAAHEEPLKEEDEDDDDEGDGHDGESDEKITENVKMKTVQHTVRGHRKGRLSSENEEEPNPRQSGKVVDSEEEELDSFDDSGKDEENQKEAKTQGQRKKKRESSGSKGKANCGQRGQARAQKSSREENVGEADSPEREAVRRVQKEVFGSSSESEEESKVTDAKGKESDDGESAEEMSKEQGGTNASSAELKGEGRARDENSDCQSDSSSLTSLEEEEEEQSKKPKQEEKKKKKSGATRKNSDESESRAKGGKLDEENKAVSRLKRYIALCGVRRNYKKLLEGCRSVKAKVAVLKKELEELGVEGQPSIGKCKKARLKREEAQELADLDVGNIIATQGRPKRRTATWQLSGGSSSPPSAFKRVVNSNSDSDTGSAGRGRKRTTDWSNLKGIISDDADSD